MYRAVSKTQYIAQSSNEEKIVVELFPQTTARVPSNIPYLVDNIWEFLRPDNMPSRRIAVFASPHRELAAQYGNDSTAICKVMLSAKATLVQLEDYQDARFHPDVRNIPKIILEHLGQSWVDSSVSSKTLAGKLFIPALSREEVASILLSDSPILKKMKDELIERSTFWQDVSLLDIVQVEQGKYPITDGELFFHAPDGYVLYEESDSDYEARISKAKNQ